MPDSATGLHSGSNVSIMDAIYQRRAVRSYTSKTVDKPTIAMLLDAAVHAPTAMHEEPWAFAVIQDKALLQRISESAKQILEKEAKKSLPEQQAYILELIRQPDFNIFYNAGTLVVIYGKQVGEFVVADCWLAAENLMLAAYSFGLGSCVIGLAVAALNTPELKKELGIAGNMVAYSPIIIGTPVDKIQPVPRKKPEIIIWK